MSRQEMARHVASNNRMVTLGIEMLISKAVSKQPVAYCAPCSDRTPHRYERLGINGRLTSRAICLVCNNDSRRNTTDKNAAGSSS